MGKDDFKAAWNDELLVGLKLDNKLRQDHYDRWNDCLDSQKPGKAFGRILGLLEGALGLAMAVKVGFIDSGMSPAGVALPIGLLLASAATLGVSGLPCIKFWMFPGPGTGDKTPPPPKDDDPKGK